MFRPTASGQNEKKATVEWIVTERRVRSQPIFYERQDKEVQAVGAA